MTATVDDTFAFISGLLETGRFEFGALVRWLRENTQG